MHFFTTIQDFTGVYGEQPFMQELRQAALERNVADPAEIHWMDCTKISGTDCYCDDDAQAELNKMMDDAIASANSGLGSTLPGVHFFDNGNYHYNSKLWTDRVQESFDLVVFDHHPDMQPPRFEGILSCGGWIKEVLDKNPRVQNVVVIGVADHLIEEIKNEPTAEFEKYADRVYFAPESAMRNATTDMSSRVEGSDDEANKVLAALRSKNVYISIDKDALSTAEAVTNWNQGSLAFEQLAQILRDLFANHNILGIDICGERAANQDYADGMDEGSADAMNNELNINLFKTLKELFKCSFFQK